MIRSWKYKITDGTVRAGFRLGKALQNNINLNIQNFVGNYQQVFEVLVWITSQTDVPKTGTTDETQTAVVCLPNFANIVSAVSSNCKALSYGTWNLFLHPALATVSWHAYTISGNNMGVSIACYFLIRLYLNSKTTHVKIWWFLPETQDYEKLVRSYSESLPVAPWTKKCLTPQDFLEMFGLEPQHSLIIVPDDFLNLCPAIVYELDQRTCRSDTDEQISTNLTTQHSGLSVHLHFCVMMILS